MAITDSQAIGGQPGGAVRSPLQVFINYRHEDSQGTAWALYMQLKASFGAENVFFDNGSLRPGMQWFDEIKTRLSCPGAFIALIGDQWTSALAERRQLGGKDYVAEEIELALRSSPNVTVIPTLVDDAQLPPASELTPSIAALPGCQMERLRHTHLEDDIQRLIARLCEIRDHAGSPPPAPSGGAVTEQQSGGGVDGPEQAREKHHRPVPSSAVVGLPPDDRHYQMVVEEAESIVVFLGAGVNLEDSGTLPDDRTLARLLAAKVGLSPEPDDLAEVAQYARTVKGEPRAFRLVRELLSVDSEPGPVHRYLAHFPKRLEELGLQKRYQMIVTPKYDAALERAFREEKEPFDVAVYMGPGTSDPGTFFHLPWDRPSVAVREPNSYRGFPITAGEDELTRTLIVRINGAVDDSDAGFVWPGNYVITEDHYIDYLTGRSAEDLVPAQILAKLRNSSCLFLGYRMADWRMRVFLKRIWQGDRLGRARHWAIERDPDVLEQDLWQDAGVTLYQASLTDYVQGLDTFLVENAEDLRE